MMSPSKIAEPPIAEINFAASLDYLISPSED
jgi:hypothetical protein